MLAEYFKRYGDGPYMSCREMSKTRTAVCCMCDRPIREPHILFWGQYSGVGFEFHAHMDCAGEDTLGVADVDAIRQRQSVPTLFEI